MGVSSISRNALAPIIEVQDDHGNVITPARVDIREPIDRDSLTDLRQIRYIASEQWGNLGYTHLGDARHWWVIAELSDVLDPFTELTEDRVLTVCSVESLYLDILGGT